MKKNLRVNIHKRNVKLDFDNNTKIKERMIFASNSSENELYQKFDTSENGINDAVIEVSRDTYGDNIVTHDRGESLLKRICGAFINPFTAILFVLVVVSVFTDIFFAKAGEQNYITVIIIVTMVLISGLLRFIQETRSGNAATKLAKMIHTTTCVERIQSGKQEIDLDDVVVGDIVHLSAGDMVPADVRILVAKDLFISQSSLTGESQPVEKEPNSNLKGRSLTEIPNLAFMVAM